MSRLKNITAGVLLAITLGTCGIGVANAETVYYRNTPVNWDHGRAYIVWSYSDVQSHVYEHSSTANSTWSGWKKKGVVAKASENVGWGAATAYWDCRG